MGDSREEARFWDQLLQFIDEGCVVPVIGRDLLTLRLNGRETLLSRHLAERLADYLDVQADGLPPGGELNAVACRYLKATGRRDIEDIYSALKTVVDKEEALPVPEPLMKLAEIQPLRLFVSTTFDPFLERALNQVRFGGRSMTQVISYSPNAPADLPAQTETQDGATVFHLVGRLSAVPDYAVTDEDLLEWVHALQSETRRPSLLFDEFSRQQILIIGCSYPDWLARFFIRAAAGDRLSMARGKTFVADATIRDDPALMGFLEHFSTRTRLFFGGGAVEFVDELHERWIARHPPGKPVAEGVMPAPAGVEPGAVFLSYASEDESAARSLSAALESAGMDVWFDKETLKAGDRFEEQIRDHIERCSVFVPLLSQHTLTPERRFFRLEWKQAERVAEKAAVTSRFVVPVVIDDLSPNERTIPESFRKIHWQELPEGRSTPEFVEHVRQLFREYHDAS